MQRDVEWTTFHAIINLPADRATAHHCGCDLEVRRGGRFHQWQVLVDGAVVDETCTNIMDARRTAERAAERRSPPGPPLCGCGLLRGDPSVATCGVPACRHKAAA